MLTVYKYPFAVTDRQSVELPRGAQPLAVQLQGGIPCLWCLVDPAAAARAVDVLTVETGHPLPDGAGLVAYVGTYQLERGTRVFHVFTRVPVV